MRQFTAQASYQASGLGLAGGFHTPRSTTGGPGRFDASGYPGSPGGTVIRPPPVPPPRDVPGFGTAGDGSAGITSGEV